VKNSEIKIFEGSQPIDNCFDPHPASVRAPAYLNLRLFLSSVVGGVMMVSEGCDYRRKGGSVDDTVALIPANPLPRSGVLGRYCRVCAMNNVQDSRARQLHDRDVPSRRRAVSGRVLTLRRSRWRRLTELLMAPRQQQRPGCLPQTSLRDHEQLAAKHKHRQHRATADSRCR